MSNTLLAHKIGRAFCHILFTTPRQNLPSCELTWMRKTAQTSHDSLACAAQVDDAGDGCRFTNVAESMTTAYLEQLYLLEHILLCWV